MNESMKITEMITPILSCNTVYTVQDISQILQKLKYVEFTTNNKKMSYAEMPCSFDIETTSFYTGDTKCASMYIWTMCIYGYVIYGRTWEEFVNVCDTLATFFRTVAQHRHIIIYVHNLSYEFQFMRKWFTWVKLFAVDTRKPIYAVTDMGIEFRCSYLLTGYALKTVAENLHTIQIKKLVGDLDYKLLRHSKTPITSTEMGYCVNDVKIVVAHIAEQIDICGGIGNIPLTKTGYVRKLCRQNCLYGEEKHDGKNKKTRDYRRIMSGLTVTPNEYIMLKNAFQGGFTHANAWKTGKIYKNVTSYDFTSSYPAVMVAEKYPMSRGENIKIHNKNELNDNLKKYCCLFNIYIKKITAAFDFEHILSFSRCRGGENFTLDNGRVVEGENFHTTVTDIDFVALTKFYHIEGLKIGEFIRYKRGYLPRDFVKTVLDLYATKTTLKGVEEKQTEYLAAKENVNSMYGMCVTDICRDLYSYTDEWQQPTHPDITEEISKYNKSFNRFLFYPWGVWVTAYARRNLYTGILECKQDYIYSDTDSIKILNAENHIDYINRYNTKITEKIQDALKFHGFAIDSAAPKTIKNVSKPLGVWDFDGVYARFKTLGAKRYLTETSDGALHLTVAGVNKVCGANYLSQFENPFEHFADGLVIPAENTGKMTHTYIDEPCDTLLTDYTGKTAEIHEKTYIHLSDTEYSLSLSDMYIDYIAGLGGFDEN